MQRWVERYYETGDVKRKDYNKRASIVTKSMLKFIKDLIDKEPTITLAKIKKKLYKKYDILISKPYIYYIIANKLNYSSKQVRKKYFPEKKLENLKQDKIKFYKDVFDIGIKI